MKHYFVTPQDVTFPEDRFCTQCGEYLTHDNHLHANGCPCHKCGIERLLTPRAADGGAGCPVKPLANGNAQMSVGRTPTPTAANATVGRTLRQRGFEMYDTCCGKALIFRSWWCACDVCGRRYVHASNGALVQTSRPTKDAPDLGESSASDSESKPAPKRVI